MQYTKQKAGAVTNPRLLQFNHRLDTVFGGIDLSMVGSVGAFRETRNEKVGLAEGPDFAHMPNTGMYFDSDLVLLYGASKAIYRGSPKPPYPTTDFATSALDNVVGSPVFPRDIVFSRWSIVEGGATIRLIDLSVYNKGTTKNTSVDGIHFLGLKHDELSRLQATTGFGPVHQRFLVFEGAAELLDDTGFPYKKYEVKVQGLDPTGQRIVVAPNPQVFVFGGGANMFCSSAFSGFVTLPNVPPDPGRMNQWERVFSGTYDTGDPDVIAVDADGTVSVDDLGNDLKKKKPKVRLKARYFFPIDTDVFPAGTTDSQKLSARKTSYPLVVIVNGNGHFFDKYDALGQHLAQNGFIVASIELRMLFVSGKLTRQGSTNIYTHFSQNAIFVQYDHSTQTVQTNTSGTLAPYAGVSGTHFKITLVGGIPDTITFLKDFPDAQGMAPKGRANVVFEHLQVLKHKFGTKVADNVGLIGHSRGGEAVVRVPRIIGTSTAPSNLRKIKAIISLAPSDLWEEEKLIKNVPYFVLYGSRDGDISGARGPHRQDKPLTGPPTGSGAFSLYDRAKNLTVKSMSFVYCATHNGFITDNHDYSAGGAIPPATQSRTALAYMNAFMRQHLLGEDVWKPYFTGEFIPGSTGYNDIFQQYKEMSTGNFRMIDDFEDGLNNVNKSSSGEAVEHSRSGTGLAEGLLNVLDPHSPHETRGLKVTAWAALDKLTYTVAAAGLDVQAAWTHLSFRITQVAGGANSSLDTMQVAIVDANDVRHPMVLSRKVPNPDDRPGNAALTKSAFMTIRMALADYSAHADLTRVKAVEFLFPASGPGNVEIDDIEFTK
jgi:dienelactone hydrolase